MSVLGTHQRDKDALSGHYGAALRHNKEGHARATNQAGRAQQSWQTKAGRVR